MAEWNAYPQAGSETQADVVVGSKFVPAAGSVKVVDNGLGDLAGVFTDYDDNARLRVTIGAIRL